MAYKKKKNPGLFKNVFTKWLYIYLQGGTIEIVELKKTTLQLYFKTFIEKINSGNLIM